MTDSHDIHIPLAVEGASPTTHELLGTLPEGQRAGVLRLILETISDAVLVHDLDGRLMYFNDSACTLLGYSRDEMLELPPFGWVAPQMVASNGDRREQLLARGSLSFQSSVLRKDGSISPTEVSTRLTETNDGVVAVSVVRDVTERAQAEAQLIYLAFHDSLTGLANRSSMEKRLTEAVADARRYGDILAVAYIDLDRFKPINDTFGHEVGDGVLVEVGRRLRAAVRMQDLVSRIGGDEFVVVLPRLAHVDELQSIADRWLTEIRRPLINLPRPMQIDASVGFAVFDPEGDDNRSLVVKADVAMYAAKQDDDNSWRTWGPSMGLRVGG